LGIFSTYVSTGSISQADRIVLAQEAKMEEDKVLTSKEFFKAVKLISYLMLNKAEYRKSTITKWIATGVVDPEEDWVVASLGCVREEDIPEIASEFLMGMCRDGFVLAEKAVPAGYGDES
jgi:hypothetical protein